jgi:hypothetical protein
MEVITVTHEKQVIEPHITYCGESPAEAAQDFLIKFGITPDTLYYKISQSGKMTCYVPAPASVMDNFYSGAFYDRTGPPT